MWLQFCFVHLCNCAYAQGFFIKLGKNIVELLAVKSSLNGALRDAERVSWCVGVQRGHDQTQFRGKDVSPRSSPLAQLDESGTCVLHGPYQEAIPPQGTTTLIVAP